MFVYLLDGPSSPFNPHWLKILLSYLHLTYLLPLAHPVSGTKWGLYSLEVDALYSCRHYGQSNNNCGTWKTSSYFGEVTKRISVMTEGLNHRVLQTFQDSKAVTTLFLIDAFYWHQRRGHSSCPAHSNPTWQLLSLLKDTTPHWKVHQAH